MTAKKWLETGWAWLSVEPENIDYSYARSLQHFMKKAALVLTFTKDIPPGRDRASRWLKSLVTAKRNLHWKPLWFNSVWQIFIVYLLHAKHRFIAWDMIFFLAKLLNTTVRAGRNPRNRVVWSPHFRNEEHEAQSGKMTCPRSNRGFLAGRGLGSSWFLVQWFQHPGESQTLRRVLCPSGFTTLWKPCAHLEGIHKK